MREKVLPNYKLSLERTLGWFERKGSPVRHKLSLKRTLAGWFERKGSPATNYHWRERIGWFERKGSLVIQTIPRENVRMV